jgi:hypothetical protein
LLKNKLRNNKKWKSKDKKLRRLKLLKKKLKKRRNLLKNVKRKMHKRTQKPKIWLTKFSMKGRKNSCRGNKRSKLVQISSSKPKMLRIRRQNYNSPIR